ncbi:hypothetical protein AQUCO_01200084v1 [Aquilegia coerulea]|uniref:CCHC-type domain-containing protein n=1 Tax=Aquilegia coerulea TaxID=218851 RepID=A0A2G5E4C2_AQUCA|nr:hypothetical protein AQUCO_01200084v1 [Aquilegia coerulea]
MYVVYSTPTVILDDLEDNVPAEWKFILLGKFYAPKFVDSEVIKKELISDWEILKDVEIIPLASGVFKVIFEILREKRKVLKNGPWSIQGYVFSVQPWFANFQLKDYPFEWIRLWIQVFGLPLERNRPFSRVQVLFHLQNPLLVERSVRSDNKVFTVKFKYERLPVFCYFCGVIGHNYRICTK